MVVHDGRNLDYRVPGSKKSAKTRRWRVIFIGGEKKQATSIVDAQDGYPRWDCEVTIMTPKPVDSVGMLVLDGKEREVGQIIVPLAEIADIQTAPTLITSNLRIADLQPTRHNSTPCGQLSFWIWVLDFWPEGTIPGAARSLAKSRSFKGSLSQIGSAFKSHSSHDGTDHSRLGKLRNVKRSDKRSAMGSALGNGGASVISGYSLGGGTGASGVNEYGGRNESIISSHAMGWSSELGAGGSTISSCADGNASHQQARSSTMAASATSYNPLASPEEYPGNFGGQPARAASSWTLGPTENSAAYAESTDLSGGVLPPKPRGRRRSVLKKIRQKVSKSSASISELGHRIKSRKSSPDGNFGNNGVSNAVVTDGNLGFADSSMMPAQQDRRPSISRPASSQDQNGASPSTNFEQQEWGLPSTGLVGAPGNISSKIGETPYGLHPEERPGKPKAEMTKRELVELANLLEQRLMGTRTELVRAHMEQNELNAKIEDLNSELSSARSQLTDLRNRLLEDNMTQYLEVGGSSRSLDTYALPASSDLGALNSPENARQSVTRLDQMKALFLGGASGRSAGDSASAQNSPSTSNGLLSRAKALASKPFGGAASSSSQAAQSAGGNAW
ncbi:hypothetical protein AAHC03_024566 [Spirometra sp. Aus1]